MSEFPDLGQHCSSCSRLDFLPIRCAHCQKVFCKDHGISHECTSEIQIKNIDKTEKNGKEFVKCKFCSTTVPILESSCCSHCLERFCLIHRHQIDHKCSKLSITAAADNKEKILNPEIETILNRIRSEFKPGINLKKQRLENKNSPLALKVALMKLKSQATGLESIPMEEREYFYLSFIPSDCCYDQANKAFRNRPVFFCKEWSIGKCVDWIAEKWSLINKNNLPNKPKLIIFNEKFITDLDNNKNDGPRKCCEEFNNHICFSHFIKDLIDSNTISTTDSLIITYLENI